LLRRSQNFQRRLWKVWSRLLLRLFPDLDEFATIPAALLNLDA